jgi:hypothetical protein
MVVSFLITCIHPVSYCLYCILFPNNLGSYTIRPCLSENIPLSIVSSICCVLEVSALASAAWVRTCRITDL